MSTRRCYREFGVRSKQAVVSKPYIPPFPECKDLHLLPNDHLLQLSPIVKGRQPRTVGKVPNMISISQMLLHIHLPGER
jgi:hypothetical protein